MQCIHMCGYGFMSKIWVRCMAHGYLTASPLTMQAQMHSHRWQCRILIYSSLQMYIPVAFHPGLRLLPPPPLPTGVVVACHEHTLLL